MSNKKKSHAKEYNDLIKDLGLDERYTKVLHKDKYDHVRDNIPPLEDKNLQADLLFLPTTQRGYKYLLTVIDLWSDEIDVRPLKTKNASTVKEAFEDILNGEHINGASKVRSDGGTEFKSDFHRYLYDNGMMHSVSLPNRHKQTGSIENVNKLLGRFLNTYMSDNNSHDWTDINLPRLISKLNNIRRIPDEDPFTQEYAVPQKLISKYEVGDLVIRKLDQPIDDKNNKYAGDGKFRVGDLRYDKFQPRKVKQILYYPNNIRYIIEGFDQVAYTEDELLNYEGDESKFNVKKLWAKRRRNNKTEYLVWYLGYKKADSLWIPKEQLIEDGFEDEINEYEKKH